MGLRLLILINLILFLAGYSGAQEQDAAEKVKSLMEACQFSQAVNLAEQFLKHDSTNIKVLNELMHVYRQLGNPDKAIAICRKISSLVPDNRYFSLQLANLYYSEEDYRQALKALVPLYLSDSSSFFVARQMGNCYNELKRSDSAIRFYRRALRITPYDPYVTGKLVNVYIREDELAMALYVTQVFLQQDSANISILKQSGYCNYLLIDFKSSAKQLRKCTSLGDSSKFTMKYLGLSYYKQEKYDSASPCFRLAFLRDTSDAEVCFYYGVSAYRSLAVDTGLVYLNRTLKLLLPPAKFLSSLYLELADANTSNGHPDTSIVLLQKALEADPENNTLRFKIAYQFDYHLRKPYEGLPWYREFLKNAPQQTESKPLLPQLVSYRDYAKNRIREIAGTRRKQ
jgi:tetratricopeptide (TPR) repeat protein